MNYDQWQILHKKNNTDILSIIMDYKHGRISSSKLCDIIEKYCEGSYQTGLMDQKDG